MEEIREVLDEMKRPPRERVRKTMVGFLRDEPFFASLLYGLEIRETDAVGTMVTNGKVLVYSPTFVNRLSDEQLAWLLEHEALHLALGHHLRRDGRSKLAWNITGDLATNWLIRYKKGMPPTAAVPGRGHFQHLPEGKTAEKYFELMYPDGCDEQNENMPSMCDMPDNGDSEDGDEDQDQSGKSKGKGKGKKKDKKDDEGSGDQDEKDESEDGEGKGDGSGGKDEEENDEDSADSKGGGSGQSDQEQEDSGSGGGSNAGDEEEPFPEEFGGIEDYPMDETTPEQAENEWERNLMNAVEAARGHGTQAGMLAERVLQMALPRRPVPWTRLLKRFMVKRIRRKFSYERPHRRWAHRKDLIMPGPKTRGIDRIAFITDTSGSMPIESCEQALVQVEDVIRLHPKVRVIFLQADTRVQYEKEFTINDFPIRKKIEGWFGRGGTDFRPALKRAEEYGVRLAIYLTDMMGTFPEKMPAGMDVVWLSTTREESLKDSHYKNPFGQLICIPDNPASKEEAKQYQD